jgi:hypothetical protein
VDDVLIDAPRQISATMISSLGIHEVIHGTNGDEMGSMSRSNSATNLDIEVSNGSTNSTIDKTQIQRKERYKYAINNGIYTEIERPTDFNLSSIVERIQENQAVFQAKIAKKKKAEAEFYEEKYGNGKKKELLP